MAITGVARETKGGVKIISADGSERLLEKGSKVYADEQIITGLRGAVSIELANGTIIEIGSESQITLNTEGVKAVTDAKVQDQSEDAQNEVTEMQQALIDGILIEDQPATAAGKTHAATGQGEDDGSSFVDVTKIGKQLKWKPKYSNEKMLCDTYDWYLKEGIEMAKRSGTTHRVAWKQGLLGVAKTGLKIFK